MAQRRKNGKLEDSTPEPWASALIDAGFYMPHTTNMIANQAALAREVDMSLMAIHRIINGTVKAPRQSTIIAIAKALKQDPSTVAGWLDRPWGADETWEPPSEAQLLSHQERLAMDELIRSIARTKIAANEDGKSAEKVVAQGRRPVKACKPQQM